MAHTSVRHTIPASATAVWSLLGDPKASAERWPAVERSELGGSGVGATRTLYLVDGSEIRERLEAYDPAARSYRFEVLSFSKLPLRELHYRVSVKDQGPGACTVEWELDFEPAGVPEAQVRGMLEGIFGSIRATILENLGLEGARTTP